MPCPKDVPIAGSDLEEKSVMDAHAESDFHRHEEQVHLEMVIGENMKSLPRKFIRCSSQATITHIKKYIAKKVWTPEKYSNVSNQFFRVNNLLTIFFCLRKKYLFFF